MGVKGDQTAAHGCGKRDLKSDKILAHAIIHHGFSEARRQPEVHEGGDDRHGATDDIDRVEEEDHLFEGWGLGCQAPNSAHARAADARASRRKGPLHSHR